MQSYRKLCGVLVLLVINAVILFGTAQSGLASELVRTDPLDGGSLYMADFLECNGTYQERYKVWWLATSNPFKFRRSFTATWFFEDLPLDELKTDFFIVKLTFLVYTNSIESGGKPTAATITVIAKNPDTEEEFTVENVRVEMNKDEVSIPTYVYIPAKLASEDGRLIVMVKGAGQIGVSLDNLLIVIPFGF